MKVAVVFTGTAAEATPCGEADADGEAEGVGADADVTAIVISEVVVMPTLFVADTTKV